MAVSTYMVSAHGNHKDQKAFFLKGYNEMLRRIEPETILCYNEPFPEMQGNIIFVDYALSSWRYMDDDPYVPSQYAKYICGLEPIPIGSNLIIKGGFVTQDDFIKKGMGSAFGGEWRPSPNKPQDERFLGEPGEVKTYVKPNGERYETKIGEDGRATRERHYTDHGFPNRHTNPHDHNINWEHPNPGIPNFEKPHINYPNGAPEFKSYEVKNMSNIIVEPPDTNMDFETISEFKDCMIRGGEVNFIWNGKMYGVFGGILNPQTSQAEIFIGEGHYWKDGIAYNAQSHEPCVDTEGCFYKTVDDVLEYVIDGERLRDIITKATVVDRPL